MITHSPIERAPARRYWRCSEDRPDCLPYEVTAGRPTLTEWKTFATFGMLRRWIADKIADKIGEHIDPDTLELVSAFDPSDPYAAIAWRHNHPLERIGGQR